MDHSEFSKLRDAIRDLQDAAIEREREATEALLRVHPEHLDSARNLLHYAALRQVDLRPLQARLSQLGLSSLGRAEARVLENLDAVEQILTYLLGIVSSREASAPFQPRRRPERSQERLERNTELLLGTGGPKRRARIMVTAATAFAEDQRLLQELLVEGMNILRINCAKDDPDIWQKTILNLRRAEEKVGVTCLVSADLAGPKLRTAKIAKSGKIKLKTGDVLWLTRSTEPGRGAKFNDGALSEAYVGCAVPEVIDDIQPGHRIFFDDGKFEGMVAEVTARGARIEIHRAPPGGANLKSGKGINLPDTHLRLPALDQDDKLALDFVTRNVDIVAQSFLRNAEDVRELDEELARRDASEMGVILKLETPSAFAQLPDVLLAGLAHQRVGAMVARGDLAVEVGFERLAEAQEEILWMCEAAHMPVIWATQVLESLAKTGTPTRAEVTDAAMAGRAECVMLNKGDYIVDAVRFLSDVLCRMEAHQQKKRAQLRRLAITDVAPTAAPPPPDGRPPAEQPSEEQPSDVPQSEPEG